MNPEGILGRTSRQHGTSASACRLLSCLLLFLNICHIFVVPSVPNHLPQHCYSLQSQHSCLFHPPPSRTDGEASNPGPPRIYMKVGRLKIPALVDTGADFCAISTAVSQQLFQQPSIGYRRGPIKPISVEAYDEGNTTIYNRAVQFTFHLEG